MKLTLLSKIMIYFQNKRWPQRLVLEKVTKFWKNPKIPENSKNPENLGSIETSLLEGAYSFWESSHNWHLIWQQQENALQIEV